MYKEALTTLEMAREDLPEDSGDIVTVFDLMCGCHKVRAAAGQRGWDGVDGRGDALAQALGNMRKAIECAQAELRAQPPDSLPGVDSLSNLGLLQYVRLLRRWSGRRVRRLRAFARVLCVRESWAETRPRAQEAGDCARGAQAVADALRTARRIGNPSAISLALVRQGRIFLVGHARARARSAHRRRA
jgi:hypothetical protein